jgi:hypothetical protein
MKWMDLLLLAAAASPSSILIIIKVVDSLEQQKQQEDVRCGTWLSKLLAKWSYAAAAAIKWPKSTALRYWQQWYNSTSNCLLLLAPTQKKKPEIKGKRAMNSKFMRKRVVCVVRACACVSKFDFSRSGFLFEGSDNNDFPSKNDENWWRSLCNL